MPNELKPCPFCGGKGTGPTDGWPHMITCENCGAIMDEDTPGCGPDYCELEADDD